jgi:hypothetical protein
MMTKMMMMMMMRTTKMTTKRTMKRRKMTMSQWPLSPSSLPRPHQQSLPW